MSSSPRRLVKEETLERPIFLVDCHDWDLDGAKEAGLRTAFVRRPLEWGPQQEAAYEQKTDEAGYDNRSRRHPTPSAKARRLKIVAQTRNREVFDAHLHIIDPRFPLFPNQGYLPDSFSVGIT